MSVDHKFQKANLLVQESNSRRGAKREGEILARLANETQTKVSVTQLSGCGLLCFQGEAATSRHFF